MQDTATPGTFSVMKLPSTVPVSYDWVQVVVYNTLHEAQERMNSLAQENPGTSFRVVDGDDGGVVCETNTPAVS